MVTKTKQWADGSTATIQYDGQGDGQIIITSDPNEHYEARSMQIAVETTNGSPKQTKTITINQAAKQRIDLSAAVVTATNQTYSGGAKTPTPTVTLNGSTVPSTGYDVSYSNNTNAGTATITITGKGDYTGTATGTFTINKATPSYTAPAARTNLTYSGGNQYLTTTGSTNDGTIKYSLDGVNWYTTRRQGSTAGTYTSYWKLEGDSNHTDISSTSISTTIAKASRTLSFADTYMVLNTSSTGTKTATPSAGSGDGAITYSIANTTYATINSSTGKVTSKTSDGSATVTASIAEGTNYLSASATYTLYVFATTHDYSYNGSYRSVTLPPGTYQFECWGAQGGACSDGYGGGKGGYSKGQLTISEAKSIRVYVGGQGSPSSGGYNGGGSTSGASSYTTSGTYGRSSMGGGGGATDIRLSDGSLYSRMIVAGGGSGGSYSYKQVDATVTVNDKTGSYVDHHGNNYFYIVDFAVTPGRKYYLSQSGTGKGAGSIIWHAKKTSGGDLNSYDYNTDSVDNYTIPSDCHYLSVALWSSTAQSAGTVTLYHYEDQHTTDSSSSAGHVGGGTTGGGYTDSLKGKQNTAGTGGSFGSGANQTTTTYRYVSGAGGGGWYGGGCNKSNGTITYCKYSGGGSGWVNTSASAGNRPSGYTGLQLDSGTTYDGSGNIPAPGGGNETGHAGNGYARITRIS